MTIYIYIYIYSRADSGGLLLVNDPGRARPPPAPAAAAARAAHNLCVWVPVGVPLRRPHIRTCGAHRPGPRRFALCTRLIQSAGPVSQFDHFDPAPPSGRSLPGG